MAIFKKLFNTLTEAPRGVAERLMLKAKWHMVKAGTPEGDGHPVLVLPGFLTDDGYASALRNCIAEKGYKAYTWNGGHNLGLNEESAAQMRERLKEIFKENKGKKITIIGYSLGGIYARELAREYPEMVRSVVTIGTPFGIDITGKGTLSVLRKVYEKLNKDSSYLNDPDINKRGLTPPPVPTTSIYSETDGIVHWKCSLNPAAAQTENIQVSSSHVGMPFYPPTVAAVLDRLSQKEGNWKPFDAVPYTKHWNLAYGAGPNPEDLPQNPNWPEKGSNIKTFFRKP